MDALADYGSDSSASSQEPSCGGAQQSLNMKATPKSSLSGLLGDVSDASSDDGEETNAIEASKPSGPATKRQRLEASSTSTPSVGANEASSSVQGKENYSLPHPPLGDSSMIFWQTDYLLARQLKKDCDASSTIIPKSSSTLAAVKRQEKMAQKLQSLQRKLIPGGCWADHLKSQHEFHNPHFFESVVELFGIGTPLGSQIQQEKGLPPAPKDYERQLLFPQQPQQQP